MSLITNHFYHKSNMKIAIEAQRIFRPNKHGMDFVALETIRELQKIDHENEYFIFVSPGPDHCLNESDNMHIVELRCPSYPLWEQVALPRATARGNATCCGARASRLVALHEQYGAGQVSGTACADVA